MKGTTRADLQRTYDAVADEYAQRIYDELRHKPLDRQLLDRFLVRIGGAGPVCDIGCGPGQVARYLHDAGADVIGIDLSPAMVERARQLNPGVEFRQGDMAALNVGDGSWAGITAFYSIIHMPRHDVVAALGELRRVLSPGGLLLLAFHIGDDVMHLDEWWGRPVCVDFHFFHPDEMTGYLESAGFDIEETIEREPYPEVEHQSRRAYVLAVNPEGAMAA